MGMIPRRHDSLCWVVWAVRLALSLIRRFLNRSSLCSTVQSHDVPSPSLACVEAFSLSSTTNSEVSGEETHCSFVELILWTTKARLTPKPSGSTRLSGQYINFILRSRKPYILRATNHGVWWWSYHNTFLKSPSCTIYVGLAQARPNNLLGAQWLLTSSGNSG